MKSKYVYNSIEPKYLCSCIKKVYLYVCIFVFLYFCILNSIFLFNVFDFWLGSQFCRSIDEAIQESQKPGKEKPDLNIIMNALNQSIYVYFF